MISTTNDLCTFFKQTLPTVVASVIPTAIISKLPSFCTLAACNHSVGKIVGGSSLMIGGSYLFVKSQVIRFTSCRWLKNLQQEQQLTPATKAALSIVGIGMVAMGVASVVEGWQELREGRSESFPQLQSAVDYKPAAPPQIQSDPRLTPAHKNIEVVVKKIKDCPEGNKLFKRFYEAGFAKQLPVITRQNTTLPSTWDPGERIMRIREDVALDTARAVSHVSYNMCSALNTGEKLEKLNSQCRQEAVSQEEYQKARFVMDYQTIVCHHKTASACVKGRIWEPSTDFHAARFNEGQKPFSTQETALEHFRQESAFQDNRNHIKSAWNRICKAFFCKTNPQHFECTGNSRFFDSSK